MTEDISAIGPTELMLRKLRREYVRTVGTPSKSTTLVMSPALWDKYEAENELQLTIFRGAGKEEREAILKSLTFEGVRVIIDPELPDEKAYYTDEPPSHT